MMNDNELILMIEKKSYRLIVDDSTGISSEIIANLPLSGEVKNIGGEIFFRVDLDIPFNLYQKEVFEVGDVVYWRSKKEEKFAIAIFYGNTKFGDGNLPRAASPCIKFASIKSDYKDLEKVESGSRIELNC